MSDDPKPKRFEKGGPPGPGRKKGATELEKCLRILRTKLSREVEPGVTYRERIFQKLVEEAAKGKEPFLGYVLRRCIPEASILKVEATVGREAERPAMVPTTEQRMAELAKLAGELGDGVLH